MADKSHNLPTKKPKVLRRKDLAESYRSLEAATAERQRSLLRPEGSDSPSSNVGGEVLGESSVSRDLLQSPLHPSSQVGLFSDFSSASELEGTSWLLLSSPEAVGINGLSGVAEGPLNPNSAGPRLDYGESSSQKSRGDIFGRSETTFPKLFASEITHGVEMSNLTQELSEAGPSENSLSEVPSPESEASHDIIEVKDSVQQRDEEDAAGKKARFTLQFTNLTYTVHKKHSKWARCIPTKYFFRRNSNLAPPPTTMRLLDDISGEARDGEILAVMGPSGSGKSTLIDALAQRLTTVQGRMTLNGKHFTEGLLRSISAYVMQDDLLFPMLTVKETLMYSACFRLPPSLPDAVKNARVMNLLNQLGLMRVANTIIGDEGHRGVSGGERRRVSIGIDIIHDPLLLFLDEPTSGLDSTSAYMVVRTLQKIAQTGSIVILSIHQPSYRMLGLLDHLILLAYGQKVYGGSPANLHVFFEAFGRPVPKHENSTEHALDLIQELHGSPGGVKELVEFYKAWIQKVKQSRATNEYPEFHDDHETGSLSEEVIGLKSSSTSMDFLAAHSKEKFANSWWVEILVLIRRSVKNIRRTPELFLMRLATVVITGILLATIFWHLDHTPTGVQERLGFFAFAMSTTFYTCADALPVFIQERYIFMRETSHHAYRKSSYVLAHAIIYIPFLAALSIAFAITIWWAVGLAGGNGGFLFFFLIVWASFWAGNSFVTLLSAIMPNVMLGYTVTVALLAYFLLLSGFFIARERIPKYWLWFHYLSIIKYPYEAVLINEFERQGPCWEIGGQLLFGTPLANLDQSIVDNILRYIGSLPQLANSPFANLSPTSCILTGPDVLLEKEITQLSKWECLGVTIGFGVFFRCLFYVALRLSGKNTRE